MLRSTFYSFQTSLSGMKTSQKQLDVTGNNIANVSTTGYTRQRADVYSRYPAGYRDMYVTYPNTSVGQGSYVGGISQCRDKFLDVRFRRETALKGENAEKLAVMKDLEMIFDEIENSGLQKSFNNLVSKLQTFSSNAESPEFDNLVRDAAQTLVNEFNSYANQLKNVREEYEYNLSEVTITKVNDLLKNIAALNESIRSVQATGGPALELKDERNLLLDELSSYMKLDVQYSPNYYGESIAVEDVTISMVSEDGTKQPLIYNNFAAKASVTLPNPPAVKKTSINFDGSAIPAGKAVEQVNRLLKALAINNSEIDKIKGKLKEFRSGAFPAGYNFDTATSEDVYTKLTDRIAANTTSSANLEANIATKKTDIENLVQAYNALQASGTATQAELEAALNQLKTARDELKTLENQYIAVNEENEALKRHEKDLADANREAAACDAALKNLFTENGIAAIPKQYQTLGDYTSNYYQFEQPLGTPILGADGNPIKWKVGSGFSVIGREDLEALGFDFNTKTQTDLEKFNTVGSLRGDLRMLNNKGTFDYVANDHRGIGYYEEMLNSLIHQFATTMNGLNDKPTTAVKEDLFQTADGSADFTASNIQISKGWLNGEWGLTATKNVLPGDNSAQNDNILLMISTISKRMDYKTRDIPDPAGLGPNAPGRFLYNGTFQEFLANISNTLSLDVSSTSNLVANHEAVIGDIDTARQSISSVSLDEEGVNIMQFQQAYNASARMMTALDEILDKLINSTGVVGR